MKRFFSIAIAILAGTAVLWAAAQLTSTHTELASLFPDDALLYLQAKDFHSLLKDWDGSEEKRAWLEGADYQAFNRSRLFERLSQAQDEFSAAAAIPADSNLLSSVAGDQSALALYDIGNLEFVYVTRMDQAHVDATPLWQVREKFEQRSEGAAPFFVHQDPQSNRVAAFAVCDGWLVLGTRADLVAGVLERIEGAHSHSLSDEDWYVDTLKQATGPADDLRMVLNLAKLVPSPYFRSYWVQRNITEMKQYRAALSDFHHSSQSYREDRILLRKPGQPATATGDVKSLLALAPGDAVFASAQAAPGAEHILTEMRENLLDLQSEQSTSPWLAPAPVPTDNAGAASSFEDHIDVAPVLAGHTDPYLPLRTLLAASEPSGMLKVYATRTQEGEMFASIDRALVLQSPTAWDESAVERATASALPPALTASRLGIQWVQRKGTSGSYSALDGEVLLYLAVRGNLLFLATQEPLLQDLLLRSQQAAHTQGRDVTYAAVFQHSPREQQVFQQIASRLDAAGHSRNSTAASEGGGAGSDGQTPPFFSGNIASLSRMFAHVSRESIEEKDQGERVTQTVVYQWQKP
jgi:hypothetical protein